MRPLALLGILIYGLVLVGLATLHGALLGLALPLVVYLAAGLLASPETPKLRVTRSLSADRIGPGAPVVVQLNDHQPGRGIGRGADRGCRADRADAARGRAAHAHEPGARRNHRDELHHQRAARALPLHQPARRRQRSAGADQPTGHCRCARADLCGARGGQAAAPSDPAAANPDLLWLDPRAPGRAGVEFFGLRPYQPGDPTRWINGRATARHPEAQRAVACRLISPSRSLATTCRLVKR